MSYEIPFQENSSTHYSITPNSNNNLVMLNVAISCTLGRAHVKSV